MGKLNGILAIGLTIFLVIATVGVALSINNAIGAYLDSTSWLVIIGAMGILDVYVLAKAEAGSQRHSR